MGILFQTILIPGSDEPDLTWEETGLPEVETLKSVLMRHDSVFWWDFNYIFNASPTQVLLDLISQVLGLFESQQKLSDAATVEAYTTQTKLAFLRYALAI